MQFRTVFISVLKNRQFDQCEVRNCGITAAPMFLIACKELVRLYMSGSVHIF
jgi:hypothetical protein